MKTHTCKSCGISKPTADYYRQQNSALGIMSSCKECVKEKARAYRLKNIDRVRAYDRSRGKLPPRKQEVRARYYERYRKRHADVARRNNLKYPERRKARLMVNNAIRDGRLFSKNCERCGHSKNIHAHHEDYTKPLDVVWLCQKCHGERHREINELKRQGLWSEKAKEEIKAA